MARFVLIHGSYHGGWCWWKVAPILRAAGHTVYTPSLTGLGDRAHLLTRDVGLSTHAQDIVRLLTAEDLHDVILVGHSYGTGVVTTAADRVPDRIGRLVLFDGSIPENGKSLFDQIVPERRAMFESLIATRGDGWLMPTQPAESFGITNAADREFMNARLRPHPAKAPQEPIQLSGAVDRVPKAFINCTDRAPGSYVELHAARAREAGWAYIELPTCHDAMVTMPREVAGFLLGLVPAW